MNPEYEDKSEGACDRPLINGGGLLLTVVICTYNRSKLLASCLRSLASQTADAATFEVLVIDNNSTDSTASTAADLSGLFRQFRVIREPKTGLSYARNCGWRAAHGEYVAYLDDDAEAYPNWISSICDFSRRHPEVGIFGGPYDPFSLEPRPSWFPSEYGTFDLGSEERPVRLGQEWLIGCNLILKKELFQTLGGFDEMLGMRGEATAYGEETELLLRMHENGVPMYYVPSVKIRHLLAGYKMKLRWLLSSHYSHGRDSLRIFNDERPLIRHVLSLALASGIALVTFMRLSGLPMKRRLYYCLLLIATEVGRIVGCCRKLSGKNAWFG